MSRRFYTDPLAAAWMGQRFGMRFVDGDGKELERDEVMLLFFQPDDPADDDPEWDGAHFIHPDSIDLLEPQVGDAVEFDRWHWERQRHEDMSNAPYKPHFGSVIQCGNGEWLEVVSAGIGWDTTFGGKRFAMQHKIIQRNGIPFHWPEQEP